MFQSNFQDSPALMQVDQNETSIVPINEMQSEEFTQAQSIVNHSKKLQDDLHMLGLKIKQHENSVKFLKNQKKKLEDSILDLQVVLGKYHSATTPNNESDHNFSSQDETVEQILRHENSAAAVLCMLRSHHAGASNLALTKDVLGIVAMLGTVDDDNLSRLLSEFLGLDTMLAIVCKTYEGVSALETYDKEGHINKGSGLHGLGASIGRALDGRFHVICLEHLRPFCGEFVAGDPQRRLALLKPKLPNGESPPGFIGFAVNMINVDSANLFYVTSSGHGLRETLFYSLFSRLQVYKSREEMLLALPCISDGAISLDGGIIKENGFFSVGSRNAVDLKFPKCSAVSKLPDNYRETEKQLKEIKWQKEKMMEDVKREQALLNNAKLNFERKKEEFVKFLADTSNYSAK